jgi:hypothetical protein
VLADDMVKQLEAKGFKVSSRADQKSDEGELVIISLQGTEFGVSLQVGRTPAEGESPLTSAVVTWQKKPSP